MNRMGSGEDTEALLPLDGLFRVLAVTLTTLDVVVCDFSNVFMRARGAVHGFASVGRAFSSRHRVSHLFERVRSDRRRLDVRRRDTRESLRRVDFASDVNKVVGEFSEL